MAAPPPTSTPPPAAANPNPSRNPKRKRKPKPKATGPSALNPNWTQLQAKLPHRPAATHIGKRKDRTGPTPPTENAEPYPPTEAAAAGEAEVKLEPTSDETSLTKAVAVDCEMVGVGVGGSKSALGRVTLVNSFGNVMLYMMNVRTVE
uniref:Exonuclease domain-containing protein n=1 Tax=Arundo donax TaxID=35708 RepID=A0A0A9FRI7_ARUDO